MLSFNILAVLSPVVNKSISTTAIEVSSNYDIYLSTAGALAMTVATGAILIHYVNKTNTITANSQYKPEAPSTYYLAEDDKTALGMGILLLAGVYYGVEYIVKAWPVWGPPFLGIIGSTAAGILIYYLFLTPRALEWWGNALTWFWRTSTTFFNSIGRWIGNGFKSMQSNARKRKKRRFESKINAINLKLDEIEEFKIDNAFLDKSEREKLDHEVNMLHQEENKWKIKKSNLEKKIKKNN